MTEAMHGTCWTEDRAHAILRSVALANDEPEFLAVHQPIRDFQVSTTTGRSIEASDEALLADLSDSETRYAFCIVEGEPGAGKSHLIRWLNVKWNRDDLVMLIERADGSLTGTLRQLRDQLGSKYGYLFENLAQSVEASFDGRVKLFHANLAASLGKSFFETPMGDEDWCTTWDVERLLGHQAVQERWGSPERILKVMSGSGGHRNSASASFNIYDIADLAQVQLAVEGLPPKAIMLMRTLKRECDRIAPARAAGVPAADLELDETLEIPQARRFLKALNDRRNFAVQHILGITVDGLRDMFFKLRRELLKEKRRLVLLLEDVTSWEGIDGQLIDSLVVDARTRSDVCDMISVVGMTPLYLKGIQGNYSGRITHVLRLGRVRQAGGFQETIQLATKDSQAEFASRYLRAARIDRPELKAWHKAGANPDTIPNKCETCASRETCFATFGASDGIGLFPFNRNAITNMFEKLEDPKGTQSLHTPRGMIQGVLAPVLLHPSRFDAGEFPPAEIEFSEWLPERALQPSGFLAQVINAAEPDFARREQLRRLMMLWGDRTSEVRVGVTAEGVRSVSGVAEGIFRSFRLPWLGEGLEAAETPAPAIVVPANEALPQQQAHEAAALVTEGQATPAPNTRASVQPGPVRPVSSGNRSMSSSTVSPARLKALAEQALLWRDGKSISDPTAWEILLVELMTEARELLAEPQFGLWERIFTKDNVKLEGSGRTDIRHFVIPREEWATRGIEAYLTNRLGTPLQPIEMESNRRAIARLLRRLAELASAQMARRVGQNENLWSIDGALAQVLLARAWLRGAISPDAPLEEQFQELLSEEQEARSLPDDRVESWGELVKATGYWHDKLRSMLRQSLNLPLGSGASLVNAGAVAGVIKSLRDTMRTVAVPTKAEFSKGLEEVGKLVELTRQTDSQLRFIPERENKSLTQRKDRALVLLRQSSLSHNLVRVDGAMSRTVAALLQAAPVQYQEYLTARARADNAGLLNDADPMWERLAEYLLADETPFDGEAEKLAHTLGVPIASLRVALETLEKAELAVSAAYKHARAFVESNQSDGDLSVVRSFGERLATAIEALRTKLDEVA
ncbi:MULTISPECIES: hypothetical protein [unclassified Rhizobium]|uniref:hypothetical protein n=1 Tax=unclassified Rhizobium TaxID=2613769 RepID=UPI0007EA996A|nr:MULTISPECIES: hypothetical protein [unclassified Rhizobium]ANM09212.1 hypothetical protein AMK05_CH00783 [Rhizobium sp. N324]OYD02780.1 hypothetical protein AMK08_CH100779 [Rhizobium sp. N4311]